MVVVEFAQNLMSHLFLFFFSELEKEDPSLLDGKHSDSETVAPVTNGKNFNISSSGL